MQVTLQTLFSQPDDGNAITVETNSHATVQTLVSTFCSQKGIAFSPKLGVFDGSKRPLPLNSTLQSAGITNGQSLYIGYKNRSHKIVKLRWPLYIALLALVVGLVGIFTMSLMYGLHGGVIPFDFGVVMDAGSSKTNTLLYEWLGDKHKGTGCVRQVDSCPVKGGIAKGDPAERIPKILECAAKVMKKVDEVKIPATPLYFAATAGMRLLNLSDPHKVEEILKQLRSRLHYSGMCVKNIDIISGRDEGIYAWTTTNFLKNTLDVVNTNPFTPVTYGALDMGGASTQIAFAVPPNDENLKNPVIQRMTLYGENHDVFAKSYLCFGRDEAARRYQALLIKDPNVLTVTDPCAPKGFKKNFTASGILREPCTQTETYDNWFKENPKLESHYYTFVGDSDYEECKASVVQLTDKEHCEEMGFKECFDKLPRQLEDQKFLAFATYFYTTNHLKVTKSTLEEYVNATTDFCRTVYDDMPERNEFAAQYCFNAVYIYEILVNGYGFNSTTWKNLEFLGDLDGKDLGWSLGYMINSTNMIPAKKPTARLIQPTVLTFCLVLFIIIVAATVVFLFHTMYRKKEEGDAESAQSLYQSP